METKKWHQWVALISTFGLSHPRVYVNDEKLVIRKLRVRVANFARRI